MVDPDDALAIAMNPLHDDVTRLAAWRDNEIAFWTQSVLHRGLRLYDVPIEYFHQVRDELRVIEVTQPKKLSALNP